MKSTAIPSSLLAERRLARKQSEKIYTLKYLTARIMNKNIEDFMPVRRESMKA